MFSTFIRFIYAASCLSFFCFFFEIVQLFRFEGELDFYWDGDVWGGIANLLSIHYPLLILLLQLAVSHLILNYAKIHLSQNTVHVTKSPMSNYVGSSVILQILPVATFLIKYNNLLNGIVGIVVILLIILVSIIGVMKYGVYNTTLIFTYSQDKVSSESTEYWLISKRKIHNFSRTMSVVEISDRVLLKI